jgi:hypothetical protein
MSGVSIEQAHEMMRDMCRWIEWDDMVNDWCIRTGGCQNVPCTCHAKFIHPRDLDGPVSLVPLSVTAQRQQRKANKLRASVRANGGAPKLRLIQGGIP